MAVVNRVVVLASDLSGEVGAESVTFDVVSQVKESVKEFAKISLDLLPAEADEIDAALTDALDAYIENVRAITDELYSVHAALKAAGSQTTGGAATKSAAAGGEAAAIREWARENGITVADRGRIHADVIAQYRDAKTTPAAPVESWDNSVAGDGDVIDNGPTDADLDALAELEDFDAEATV